MMTHIGSAFDEIQDSPVPSDAIGPLYVETDIIGESLRLEDGFIHVPPGPGLGVALDEERVDRFRVR
jgi:muconate cycloisomerase